MNVTRGFCPCRCIGTNTKRRLAIEEDYHTGFRIVYNGILPNKDKKNTLRGSGLKQIHGRLELSVSEQQRYYLTNVNNKSIFVGFCIKLVE